VSRSVKKITSPKYKPKHNNKYMPQLFDTSVMQQNSAYYPSLAKFISFLAHQLVLYGIVMQ